jgi:hypothetical protein
MRLAVLAIALGISAPVAAAGPARPAPAPTPQAQLQKEADRHFQRGVALFRAASYAEALAEFARAYDIAPHPLVLYNIAECHRELLHYAEAVAAYRQFLVDGADQVPAARLATAQTELTALLALVARVTVTVAPWSDDVVVILDGAPLLSPVMPLIVAPGEHRLIARAAGKQDAVRALKLGAGDALTVELVLGALPVTPPGAPVVERAAPVRAPAEDPRFAVDAGFGMNLRRAGNTGAPSIGGSVAIGSRLAVGVDVVLVAYAVIPAVRVRLAGDALSLHLVGAVPIAFPDDAMAGRFVTVAAGLALRYRPTPRLAVRLESYVSFGGAHQDTALPALLGGELWF